MWLHRHKHLSGQALVTLMPSYLSADYLKAVVTRLQRSRATPEMMGFLVLKRTLALAKSDQVTFTPRNVNFQQALNELMSTYMAVTDRPPHVNVYGNAGDKRGVYLKKALGDGPSVHVPRWAEIVEVRSRGPVVVALKRDYLRELPNKLLKQKGEMPRLSDSASWFFRNSDVSEFVGGDADDGLLQRMVDAYVERLDLTPDEVTALFDNDLEHGREISEPPVGT